MLKTCPTLATVALLLSAPSAWANPLGGGFSWSGEAAISSNEIDRGVSVSGGHQATHLGFAVEHRVGSFLRADYTSIYGNAADHNIALTAGHDFRVAERWVIEGRLSHSFYGGGTIETREYTETSLGVRYLAMGWETRFRVANEIGDQEYNDFRLDGFYTLSLDQYILAGLGYTAFDEAVARESRNFGYLGLGHQWQNLQFRLVYHRAALGEDRGGTGDEFVFTLAAEF